MITNDSKATHFNFSQEKLMTLYEQAKKNRSQWEGHWQDCYDFALPQRKPIHLTGGEGAKRTSRIFDSTALNAVDHLASSLLSELTPPWSRWFHLTPGNDVPKEQEQQLIEMLEETNNALQDHFDRSNFAVEIHQCYQDLVTAGTASLLFEESKPGSFSAFKFKALPLSQVYLLEDEEGKLNIVFRQIPLSVSQIKNKYNIIPDFITKKNQESQTIYQVMETVIPCEKGYDYFVFITEGSEQHILDQGHFERSPFLNFRWSKSPGETYGRSPVMKALPDIKTANKVVELILKNASIAVTGIWQADDDGVLNPANIKLKPGTIIPKAIGSAGLKPLEMPGNFDVSQLVLEDLRARIRNALMADNLSQIGDRRMTATEVLERANEIARMLGATYGRLQSELLTPLVLRAHSILRRRGEVPDLSIDGRRVMLNYISPLAKAQKQRDIQVIISWVKEILSFGEVGASLIDIEKAARLIGQSLGVPNDLMREQPLKEDIKE